MILSENVRQWGLKRDGNLAAHVRKQSAKHTNIRIQRANLEQHDRRISKVLSVSVVLTMMLVVVNKNC